MRHWQHSRTLRARLAFRVANQTLFKPKVAERTSVRNARAQYASIATGTLAAREKATSAGMLDKPVEINLDANNLGHASAHPLRENKHQHRPITQLTSYIFRWKPPALTERHARHAKTHQPEMRATRKQTSHRAGPRA